MALEVRGARRRPVWEPGPARIARVDPPDGACGVFRDACVMAQLTRPADPRSLTGTTFRIEDDRGVVPASLHVSPDRVVLVWRADRLLVPHVEHVIHAEGIRDLQGRAIEAYSSRFVPCDLVSNGWPP